MKEQENAQKAQALYAAFGRGDIQTLLSGLTPDVDWTLAGPAEIPLAGQRRGRDQVAAFFKGVGEMIEFQQFEPQEFIAQGDKVVVIGHERGRVKATGCAFDEDWVPVFTLREGKVTKFREYYDTAAVLAAFRGV